jgi:hypothetical protein
LIDDLPVTVRIDSDIPESAAVGQPTPEFVVNASVPVEADTTKALGRIGVKTIEGTVEAKVRVTAPDGDTDLRVPFRVKTDVPASGSFHVRGTGSAPPLTFTLPGRANVSVGDLVARLTPKDASGDVTFPGEIEARCTMDPGQDDVIAWFRIAGTGTTTGPADSGTTGATGPADSGTTGATGTSGSGAPAADEATSGTAASKPKGVLSETGAGGTPWLLGGAGVLLAAGAGAVFAVRRTRRDDRADDAIET